MSLRKNSWILAFALCGCQLPESGAKPSEAAIAGGSASNAESLAKLAKNRPTQLRPKLIEQPKAEQPKPTGEETGALIGLRAAHDEARAAVGVAPLEWSATLGSYAQEWANYLAANNCQLAHRPNSTYGENLYWTSSAVTAPQVVAAWTLESASYDAATNTCSEGNICGHYTQVIWANTLKLGCGMASCGSQQVWVCNYDPRGNYSGQKPFVSTPGEPG
jgi:pathogenesis-related protein 1